MTATAARSRPTPDRRIRLENLASRDQATALLTALTAFWLFIGAWAVGYAGSESGGDAYLNESVVGVLLLFCALARLLRPLVQVFPSVLVLLLGAWLIVSPFIWGYADYPYRAGDAAEMQWGTGAVTLLLGAAGLLWARAARHTKQPL
jgi:heme/copper-type cytochrome/quinol oxidase subunit 3